MVAGCVAGGTVDAEVVFGKVVSGGFAAPTEHLAKQFYSNLAKHFRIENQGPPTTFFGLNITRTANSLTINQTGYIEWMLARFNMTNAITATTPLDGLLPLPKATSTDRRADIQQNQELVGSLNHAAIFSRPDISFAVSQLSQFLTEPTSTHMAAAKRVLRSLIKHTKNLSITYHHSSTLRLGLEILGFTDANWAGDKNDRKSTTGYVFIIGGGPMSWTSHKQTTIALSTMEAEYMALSDASCEAIACSNLFSELNIKAPVPLLHSDNQGALTIAENPTNYQRAKHIDIRYHFIRHALEQGKIQIEFRPTAVQPADVLTKAHGPQKHLQFLPLMGLHTTVGNH
jgi:Reverse transcriptase (RNA-dependent DNA polymerase)